jgi:hypothetical protein
MKAIKKGYNYLFYKLYKWIGEDNWWTDWKTALSVDVLIYYIVIAFFIYYKIYFNPFIHLSENNTDIIILVIIVSVPNYFIFHHRDQWKDIVKEFDKLPIPKNIIGGWIVFGVVMLIIANMVFAFYQMSLIDWSQYR